MYVETRIDQESESITKGQGRNLRVLRKRKTADFMGKRKEERNTILGRG